MKVKECMCKDVICAKENSSICDVAKLMEENHVGCIPICNDKNELVGLITDRDIALRGVACNKNVCTTPASEIMTTKVYNLTPDCEVTQASNLMCECQVRRVPVLENNKIIGIISLGDLAHHPQVSNEEVSTTVEGICRCNNNPKNAE